MSKMLEDMVTTPTVQVTVAQLTDEQLIAIAVKHHLRGYGFADYPRWIFDTEGLRGFLMEAMNEMRKP